MERSRRRGDRDLVTPVRQHEEDANVMPHGHVIRVLGLERQLVVVIQDGGEEQDRGLVERSEMFFHEVDDLALRIEELLDAGP